MHNYLYKLSRRIAISYHNYLKNADANEIKSDIERMYVFLDDLLSRVKRIGSIPTSSFIEDDVMILHGLEFIEYFNGTTTWEQEEILKIYPSEDIDLWSFTLSEILTNRDIDIRLNDLSEDLLRKCIYMRNIPPYSTEIPDPNKYLTPDEIKKLTAEQLEAVILAIEAYDITYGIYGLDITENGQCYIKDTDKTIYTIPVKRTIDGYETDLTPCRQIMV